MTGPSVVWLQQKLGIAADGTFGTGTDAAVRHYQAAHGLTADGVVGNATWASLGVGQGQGGRVTPGHEFALVLVALGLLSRSKKRRNAYYRAQWWF